MPLSTALGVGSGIGLCVFAYHRRAIGGNEEEMTTCPTN